MHSKTAILVFANSAKEELLHKPMRGGEQLFAQLNESTIAVVKSTHIPYYVISEEQQYGVDFGERFVNAVQSIFKKGYEKVITIGNDTPLLNKTHLLQAAQLLEEDKFVIGPSADGGFYLMGLCNTHFDPSLFLNLPWQSRTLTVNLIATLEACEVAISKLQVLYDIDSVSDLKIIQKFSRRLSLGVLKALELILSHSKSIQNVVSLENTTIYHTIAYNKGSPAL